MLGFSVNETDSILSDSSLPLSSLVKFRDFSVPFLLGLLLSVGLRFSKLSLISG